MGIIKTLGRLAWRLYVVDGVPSSGANEPLKSDILAFVDALESEPVEAPAIAAGLLTLDLDEARTFTVANSANMTGLTIDNATAGEAAGFDLFLVADGTLRTWTWPASVFWVDGGPPVLTATNGKLDWLAFKTRNGGTTWYALVAGQELDA